jgi:ABC-2 type transport system permease protein
MSALNGKFAMLLRRELWEHRTFWLAPVVVIGTALIMALIQPGRFGPGEGPVSGAFDGPDQGAVYFGRGVMIILATVLGGVASISIVSYLLDCLYAERKDRSILFWKSLPVSDAQTVLTKILVALVVAPLLALLIAALVLPLMLLVLKVRFNLLAGVIGWDAFAGGYSALPRILAFWFSSALWYAPFAAYLLLASVLARRVPLMYAVLPPAALMLLEGTIAGSSHVAVFIGKRLVPWMGDSWALNLNPVQLVWGTGGIPDWKSFLLNPDLWLGVAAAAVMVYIVIRLRRYRDDT